METNISPRPTSREFAMVCKMIAELKEEVRDIRNGVHDKIDSVASKVKAAFEGFGILDPEEEVWTEQQVCERYQVCRRTMYNYRNAGRIAATKSGKGRNCKLKYRKADVIEMFAALNAK